MTEEKVICILHGDVPHLIKYLEGTGDAPGFQLQTRKIAEFSKEFAHLIVYPVIMINGKYLCYQRKSETEVRLDGNIAFFGGHVNVDDMLTSPTILDYINNALQRELEEELDYELAEMVLTGKGCTEYSHFYLGLINSMETEVDSVHLGYCYLYRIVIGKLDIISSNQRLMLIDHPDLLALALAGKTDNWIKIVLELKRGFS